MYEYYFFLVKARSAPIEAKMGALSAVGIVRNWENEVHAGHELKNAYATRSSASVPRSTSDKLASLNTIFGYEDFLCFMFNL